MQTVKIIIEDGRIEQFNEEVMKEFDNFIGRSDIINSNFIKNFIAQKLAAHKELILKMVRERAPRPTESAFTYTNDKKCKNCNGTWKKDQCDCHGRNIGIGEFLNNLDTI